MSNVTTDENGKHALVALSLELVVRTASLEQRLVDTATTGDNADGRTGRARDGLLRAGGQTDARLVLVRRVANDGRVVAGSTGERTAVADLLLNVADDGTLGALGDGEGVADGEGGLLAAVDEGTGVKTLGGDEGLLAELVAVRVPEDDAGEGRATARREDLDRDRNEGSCLDAPARVVDDLFHHAADVAIALAVVERAQLRRRLVKVGVRLELCGV